MMIQRFQLSRLIFIAFLALMPLVQTSCDGDAPKTDITVSISEDRDAARRLLKAAIDMAGKFGIVEDTALLSNEEMLEAIQESIEDSGEDLITKSPDVLTVDIPLQSGRQIQVSLAHDFLIEQMGRRNSLREQNCQKRFITNKKMLLKDEVAAELFFVSVDWTPIEPLNKNMCKFQGQVILKTTIKAEDAADTLSIENPSAVIYIGEK